MQHASRQRATKGELQVNFVKIGMLGGDDMHVPVRIAFSENRLKNMAKTAGGKWNSERRCWLIPSGKIKGALLENHIIVDAT